MPIANQDPLQFDVVVLGAGTAGLAAAKSAHAEGARVAVVDHGPLGTLCARLGCMPSKALLQSTLALSRARRMWALGVELASPPTLDWPAARARKSELVADFVAGVVRTTTTSNAFTLLHGNATFIAGGAGESTLDVGGARVLGKRVVLATGSSPAMPPIPGLDEISGLTLTSADVFELEAIPSSVAVIGMGAVAVELGQFLARAGARVHLVAGDDHLAGLAPGAMRDALAGPLGRELTLHPSTRIDRARRGGEEDDARGVTLTLATHGATEELHVERILIAAGRKPNLEGLELSRVGVRVEDGVPVHDEYLRTTNPTIFVAGDAAGSPALLHTATIQGRTAGQNAAGSAKKAGAVLKRAETAPLLQVVFCDPILATVGLDPEAAKQTGHPVCAVSRPWSEQGKARIIDETDGLAQLVFDRATRKLLGCQLVGAHADLLIHLASYALHFGATAEDLVLLHHYHPTLAEMIPSLAQKAISALDGVECVRGEVAPIVAMQ